MPFRLTFSIGSIYCMTIEGGFMIKKSVSIFTLFCFLLSSWSCVVKKKVAIAPDEMASTKSKTDIIAVLKTSGERIEFHKAGPGHVQESEIIGCSGIPETVEFPKSGSMGTLRLASRQVIKSKDGREFLLLRKIKEDKATVVFEQIPQIRIPLNEIQLIYIKKTDGIMTFFATVGVIGGIILGGLGIIAAMKESCPFIYSYDGQNYIFDAEPYGGATCPGLQRTEWVKLEHLKEVESLYRIRLTNEVEETQYTDELKLVVVDHDPGTRIAPDENGVMHTFSQPHPPTRAVDGRGHDILGYVSETDWIFWESNEEDSAAAAGMSTKDELLFEFSKPAGATEVKILFNGCNTLWASQMVKKYLELHGKNISACYAALNSRGMAYELTKRWNLEEELYELQIRVETRDGWKTRGVLIGGGPFISEDKAYVVDVTGVDGDVLRIRLTPPAAFWAINSIAVDFMPDQPIQIENVSASEAIDASGANVSTALQASDRDYYVMPEIGNSADLTFVAPPHRPGRERTVLAKVSGYYDIHLDATGDAQTTILGRFLSEPGFGGRWGLDEYKKWKKESEIQSQNR